MYSSTVVGNDLFRPDLILTPPPSRHRPGPFMVEPSLGVHLENLLTS